jgi:hypothetical protein
MVNLSKIIVLSIPKKASGSGSKIQTKKKTSQRDGEKKTKKEVQKGSNLLFLGIFFSKQIQDWWKVIQSIYGCFLFFFCRSNFDLFC